MVLQNIKVKEEDRSYIDAVKGNKPRNAVVSDAIKVFNSHIKVDLDIYKRDYVNRLLNSIENTVIIPVDKRTRIQKEIDELRRIVN